ncbi:MAG: glyceraldehyde-3-phosphate dehydrogenase [Candidatus Aenigmarchaeota archaeon]|nr:glyceraldehyde-3-phosphate dehydrogenase [Candidatus Aenigmarchaeota archaeon]
MTSNFGFVGFDGTENKRTIFAADAANKYTGNDGDLNVLLRNPHPTARATLAYMQRDCQNVVPYISDEGTRQKWEGHGVKVAGNYQDFLRASDALMIGTPSHQEPLYVRDGLNEGCFIALMGGADREEILKDLEEKKFNVGCGLKEDLTGEFFFGMQNYGEFLERDPQLVQCTSCNTTGLSRLAYAARPLGLTNMAGNIDRRIADPPGSAKGYINSVEFGDKPGHQGEDAGTVFKDVDFKIRASKIPTTVPHVNDLMLVFEGEVTPKELVDALAGTSGVVVMPYKSEGKKYSATGNILENVQIGLRRPWSPNVYEALVSEAIIPVNLGDKTMLQTKSMTEQMSIAVPNHVEALLLNMRYPESEVRRTIDESLGLLHGVWPDKLSAY